MAQFPRIEMLEDTRSAADDRRRDRVRLRREAVSQGRRLERLWVVELDGAPIRAHRRLEIQTEVLSAVQSESPPLRSYLTSSSRRRPVDEDEPPSAA